MILEFWNPKPLGKAVGSICALVGGRIRCVGTLASIGTHSSLWPLPHLAHASRTLSVPFLSRSSHPRHASPHSLALSQRSPLLCVTQFSTQEHDQKITYYFPLALYTFWSPTCIYPRPFASLTSLVSLSLAAFSLILQISIRRLNK